MKRTLLILEHKTKSDLFIIVIGDILKAYDVAYTYKVKRYSIKEITPAKICIFQNEKCPIISEYLSCYTIFYNEKELTVSSTQIEIL